MTGQTVTVLEPPTHHWCLCVPASTFSFIIGAVYFAVNIAAILAGFVYLGVTHGGHYHLDPELTVGVRTAVLCACFVCALNALACCLLMVGVRRRRWELEAAWLTWYGIFLVCLSLSWLGGVIHLVRVVAPAVHPADTVEFSWAVLVPLVPVGIIVIVFVWYAYAAVLSHCRALRAAPEGKMGAYRVIREA
ncbi:uncharacterized protein LOC122371015 [Amphibalanus amphitrite]|uniref:uncharacterized protein LOC122371015 n=1 Tax=Amphibalanus amphitrite TaxID=1232801 RepID=UPI001C91BE9F|nr:uncharacterized protein LOC122371015 [Amphibalanus amphitrite]XP_043202989.1 uncharacterized protein LOC122371015 [Amphibalanus amphitrite]